MSDLVFSGPDLAAAVSEASRVLGQPADTIRYVVLDAGTPGGRGITGTPARIAVIVNRGATAAGASAEAFEDEDDEDYGAGPAERLQAALQALAKAGLDLEAAVEPVDEEDFLVRISGNGARILLEGDGEALTSLEHLLQRIAAPESRLTLECEGRKEKRETALRELARTLCDEVLQDGKERQTRPLNSYERRLIHMVVAEQAGLRSFSVGEGADRRVTIAKADADDPNPTA